MRIRNARMHLSHIRVPHAVMPPPSFALRHCHAACAMRCIRYVSLSVHTRTCTHARAHARARVQHDHVLMYHGTADSSHHGGDCVSRGEPHPQRSMHDIIGAGPCAWAARGHRASGQARMAWAAQAAKQTHPPRAGESRRHADAVSSRRVTFSLETGISERRRTRPGTPSSAFSSSSFSSSSSSNIQSSRMHRMDQRPLES